VTRRIAAAAAMPDIGALDGAIRQAREEVRHAFEGIILAPPRSARLARRGEGGRGDRPSRVE
jgi:hypothetical protein